MDNGKGNGRRRSRTPPRPINLALQGGGSHGAFTWGVLDCLLEDGRFAIEGVSGTSAGAMNAVCLADGMTANGPEGARQKLHDFWRAVGRNWRWNPVQRTPWDVFMGNWSLDHSPAFLFWDTLSRFFSPYDVNPLNANPLLDTIRAEIDFERIHRCDQIKVFVSATNVWNGKVRVFEETDVTAEAVMASACLPQLFQAVEIDGVPHWDGGFMGNPSLFPFFEKTRSEDIVLVQINSVERTETPRTARDILDRVDEITFNASLLKEFRAIEFVSRLIDEGKLQHGQYKQIRMHRIAADEALQPLSASSKSNTEWQFLKHLRDIGRAAAFDWLDMQSDKVGVEPGIDLEKEIAYRLVSPRDHPPATPRVRDMLAKMRDAVDWRAQEKPGADD